MHFLKAFLVLSLLAVLPSGKGDAGQPLILTPMLNGGKISKAQSLAKVNGLTDKVVSYSGYFTVNESYNSNIFFWFFPAQSNSSTSPVTLWLQGGPGATSLLGLFGFNGPLVIDANDQVSLRNTSWSLTQNILYIDQPVGTGFSFTNNPAGYARTEDDVARDLYSALTQFYTLFPEYKARDFFAAGESYGGKYVPAISAKIHQENQGSPKVKINLKGMAIGDGRCDPLSQLNYGDYLYNIGLLDWKQKLHFDLEEERIALFTALGQYTQAFRAWDALIGGQLTPYPTYYQNITGLSFVENFLYQYMPNDMIYYNDFVQKDSVRKAIHVGNTPFFNNSNTVGAYMENDFFQSSAPQIRQILDAREKYSVLMYSGQLDVIVANTLTVNFLQKLRWHGTLGWTTAEKQIWRVNGTVAGYAKVYDNLTYLLVRNSGHMVPYDQPEWGLDMINRFISGKPYA